VAIEIAQIVTAPNLLNLDFSKEPPLSGIPESLIVVASLVDAWRCGAP
jgi:hypothetical protein